MEYLLCSFAQILVTSNKQNLNVGKSKEGKKKKKKKRERDSSKEADKSQKEEGGAYNSDVYLISSGDEDDSKGMKSMNYSI